MTNPDETDVQIIDAAFFLHLHKDLPANFLGVATYLFMKILQRDGKVIHFLSDKWITPSIKDCESYHIAGAAQKRQTNWLAALCRSNFKSSLVESSFAWSNSDCASLFEGRILFTDCGNICYKFMSILDKVIKTKERSFLCIHEEADSRIFFTVLCLEN